MADTPEEVARKFKEQARVQQANQEMLRVQQESINGLKQMINLLLTNSKKSKDSKTDASSSKSKRKQKEVKAQLWENWEWEQLQSKSSYEEEGGSKNGDNHSRRMKELEKRLEAIANRSNF